MNSIPKFQMYNFSPRIGVPDKVNHILEGIIQMAPSDSNCTAVIERYGDKFVFEITLRSINEIFHSKFDINIRDRLCRERFWQVDVVSALHGEIKGQIHKWHERRFAA